MRYKRFGNAGLSVLERSLGSMTFGGEGGRWVQIGTLQQGKISAADWPLTRCQRQLYRRSRSVF